MKTCLSLCLLLLLSGCQVLTTPAAPQNQPEPEPVIEPVQPTEADPGPAQTTLAISDDSAVLKAWVQYRASILTRLNEERDTLNTDTATDEVRQLKRTILQLHPDTPYLTRLRIQMQLAEQLLLLPAPLAELLSWDLAFNQKLLEAESAVSALTRLNAQQHDNIERLQKTNRELQKKIDALTQIEAQLNKPAVVQEDNNGQ